MVVAHIIGFLATPIGDLIEFLVSRFSLPDIVDILREESQHFGEVGAVSQVSK